MEKNEKTKTITLNPVSKKARKHPYVNFEPTDTNLDDPKKKKKLGEAKVTAINAHTGRRITRTVRGHDKAYERLHKWLKKRGYKDVRLTEHLAQKADDFELPFETLSEVFERGEADFYLQNPQNLTCEQWAMARVNSFIQGGRALDEDAYLVEAKKYTIGKKTPKHALTKLAKREDDIGKAAQAEIKRRASLVYPSEKHAHNKIASVMAGKSKLTPEHATRIINTLKLNPNSHMAKNLRATAQKHNSEKMKARAEKKSAARAQQQHWDTFYSPEAVAQRKADRERWAREDAEKAKSASSPGNREINIAPAPSTAPKRKGLFHSVLSKLRIRESLQNDLEQQNATDAQPQQDRSGINSNAQFQKAVQRRNKKHAQPPKDNTIKPAPVSEAVSSYTKPTAAKPKMKSLTTEVDKIKNKFKMERHKQHLHKRINKMRTTCAQKLVKFFKDKK